MTHRRLTSVERKVRDLLGEGATIGKVASTLKMRERAVRTIASRLENYGEIVRVPGTKSPILYELVKKDTTNPPTGGSDTEKGNYGPSVRKTPPKTDIVISKLNQTGISVARKPPGPEYARAHISGLIGMEIHRVGSLDDIPDPRGADKFGYVGYWEKPDKSMRGSTVYKSCLRINGQEIKVHYRCGNKGGKTFAIYPGQIWINPLCFDSQQDVFDVFIDFANVIAEILRPQGWIVDHPQIKGKTHLAWPDHSLVQHFRSDIVAEGELICDTSTGVPEVEIEDLEKEDSWRKAQLMADLPNRFLHLESEVDMLTDGARSNTETLADIRSEIGLMISTI